MPIQDNSLQDRHFNDMLQDGISAVKTGRLKLAQSLLNRATMLNGADARPYLWLSATTQDPEEQRQYLEQAVARDPSNAAARQGLAMLMGKIDVSRLATSGAPPIRQAPDAPVTEWEGPEAQSRSFVCPNCSGRMTFIVANNLLTCDYCGFEQAPERSASPHPVADVAEQVFDFVMPTTTAHNWAAGRQRMACQNCGAVSLLAPGQKSTRCAYCGANQWVEAAENADLIDPQVILTMKMDEKEALRHVREWLGRGFFLPDDLRQAGKRLRLRPAYYSFWTFDGTLEVRWSCEVKESSGRYANWVSRSGLQSHFFDDVLVPGVRTLQMRELERIEPFYLKDVEEFKPEYLAGWPAVIYDRPLSDASLLGRERVMKQFRPQLYNLVEMGHEKRNLTVGEGNWSDITFKHVLLPIWIGTYQFQGVEHHVLVNGQTGKVGGSKPRDTFKITFSLLTAAVFIILLFVLYWVFFGS